MRLAIPAKVRLMVTLTYLTSGANFHVMEDLYRISHSTISKIIPEAIFFVPFVLMYRQLTELYPPLPRYAMPSGTVYPPTTLSAQSRQKSGRKKPKDLRSNGTIPGV
jgi:hypothetical protein